MRPGIIILLILLAVSAFVILGLLGVGLFFLVCSKAQSGLPVAKGEPTIVTATDGRSEVRLPPSWTVRREIPPDEATIKIGDPKREAYLIVLTDAKSDFADDLTYRSHSGMTRERLMKNLDQARTVAGPTELVINGRKALQYEIHAVSKKTRRKLIYLHTTVDGEKSFHELLAWSLESRAGENRPALDEALGSFADVP